MLRLDSLAEAVKDRLDDETAPLIVLEEVIHTLFEREGLRGNKESYHDPRNSFMNDVLDRRLGIPLTLSIILLEVGWRLNLPLEGVNFPGHFLVRYHGVGRTPFGSTPSMVDEFALRAKRRTCWISSTAAWFECSRLSSGRQASST